MSDDLPALNVWWPGSTQYEFAGRIVGYESLTCETAFLSQGTWNMTVPAGAAGVNKVLGDSLVTVDWQGTRWATGRTTTPKTTSSNPGQIGVEFSGETGLTMLQGVTCYPNPTLGLGAQPEFGVYNDVAETVVRSLVRDHYQDRYGKGVTLPTSLGRGGTVKIKTRMDDLLHAVTKAAKRGGIGVDVGLVNAAGSSTRADLTLSLYVPEDRTSTAILSSKMGTLRGWEYTETRPTMTKAIVGGEGTGPARVWRIVTTPASEAAAVRWGGHIEGFVDASDTADTGELDQRGAEALDEALTEDTFKVEASNAPGMRIWEVARLGDTVSVVLASGVSTTQPLGGLKLSVTVDEGPKVTPIIGDSDGSTPDRMMARLVRQSRRQIRQLQVTRERT